MTEQIYSTDAYARGMDARVVDVDPDDGRVLLDRTVFYPGGGGQPHDVGELLLTDEGTGDDRLAVTRVTRDRRGVWHWLGDQDRPFGALPAVGTALHGTLDWERRHLLMRTHTAMHALCGVVWERFGAPVTGGDMRPGTGRLDFEIPDWDSGRDRDPVEEALNRELASDRRVEIAFLPRAEADEDPSLIRTKVSLLPPDLTEVRVVDIVGLDRQADGGTHVQATGEVGPVRVAKVDNKGRGFRRIRLALD